MKLDLGSARIGPPRALKKVDIFQYIKDWSGKRRSLGGGAFSARRQDLPFAAWKRGWRDCLTRIRPILKSGFQPFPKGQARLAGTVPEPSNRKRVLLAANYWPQNGLIAESV
jgi:hypothetical protein